MNQENISVIDDDLAVHETDTANVSASHEGSWLAGRQNVLAETFLQERQAEFQEYQRRERDKMIYAERTREFETEIAARRRCLEKLRTDVADCQAADMATELFKNMERTGRPLLELAQSPLFSGVALVKDHGKKLLQLAEKDLADLQKKFDAFKSEKGACSSETGNSCSSGAGK